MKQTYRIIDKIMAGPPGRAGHRCRSPLSPPVAWLVVGELPSDISPVVVLAVFLGGQKGMQAIKLDTVTTVGV